MKSFEIKNWQKVLPFKEVVKLDDFRLLLVFALRTGQCLLCSKLFLMNNGLCQACFSVLDKENKSIAICLALHQVDLLVGFPQQFPWEDTPWNETIVSDSVGCKKDKDDFRQSN